MKKILLVLAINAVSCLAHGLEYWPIQPDGVVYHYQRIYGDNLDILYANDGNIEEREYRFAENYNCYGGEFYEVSDTSIALVSHSVFCAGEIDAVGDTFWPPMPIARANMQDGDCWVWVGGCNMGSAMVLACVNEEVLTIPLGTMPVLHIVYTVVNGNCYLPYNDLYLHRDYGPIRQGILTVTGWDGPVNVEQVTWGKVKSMFR